MKERAPALIAIVLLISLVIGTWWAADYAQRAIAIDPPRRITHEPDSWASDFVVVRSDAEGVAMALNGLQAVGDTALHDALVHSLYYFRGMTGQRALVLLSDVDGVLTDGGVVFDNQGIETKRFHIRDGLGIKLWQRAGFRFGLVTGRASHIVRMRAAELGVELRFLFEKADADALRWKGLADEVVVLPRHDAQQGALAGPVEAQHADLGAGQERQPDIPKNDMVGRVNLAQTFHGVDVLSHWSR